MQKLRQIVSDLALDAKALNIDDRISFRYLANKFRDKLAYFLRLDARSREFVKDLTIWKAIRCVELEDIATNLCDYIDDCNTLKRSKVKIPDAYNTNYGLLIKVFTIDRIKQFTLILSNNLKTYTTGEFISNKLCCWIEDGYLYIPNTDIESVTVLILAKDPSQVDALNNCTTCNYPLESDLNYSDYLITLAKAEVMKELVGGYKRMVSDEKGDDNNNSKQ